MNAATASRPTLPQATAHGVIPRFADFSSRWIASGLPTIRELGDLLYPPLGRSSAF